MKNVISTVGASIIENYRKNNGNTNLQMLKLSIDKWENMEEELKVLENNILKWAQGKKDASAEITSIIKISEDLKEDLEVYLISTYTITSKIASEIILKWFESYDHKPKINVIFNDKNQVIKGLQVEDRKAFEKEGIPNILNWFYKEFQYFGDMVFNLTGGYKGLIPFLTILAQINEIPIYYKFEETEELIKIPQAPLKINNEIFEKYQSEFLKLEQFPTRKKDLLNRQFLQDASSLIEDAGDICDLNPMGKIFWDKYKFEKFFFYCPDEVWNDINKMPDIKRILEEKFYKSEIRKSKKEIKGKGKHIVYDDGNNNNRIFYFEIEDNIYIYKVFNKEIEEQKYLDSGGTYIDRESIIKNSKIRVINKSKI
ncbi:hypothetical protein [Athalassotoga saccharophila]|uniref:hypothetical protein n=1 Tax=Athalassotoga saccharophila TaxID=1441386 RepID=UPI00137AF9C1|nr:hypothetical protein [Athalassotoga saccharophila]BBJ28677.1 CRISPR-associated protein [Athalassotoga saccharophila]